MNHVAKMSKLPEKASVYAEIKILIPLLLKHFLNLRPLDQK